MNDINWKEAIVDFFIYAGILVHISTYFPMPLGPGAQDIGVHLAFILVLLSRNLNYKKIFLNKLSLAFLLFFASLAVSSLLYSDLTGALDGIRSRLKGVTLFFTIQALCVSEKKKDNVFCLSLFPLLLISIVLGSYIPYLLGTAGGSQSVGYLRAFGIHKNVTAKFWNMGLAVTMTSFLLLKQKILKIVLAVFLLLTFVGIPLTLSKGGIISFVFIVLSFMAGIMILYRDKISFSPLVKKLSAVTGGTVFLALLFFWRKITVIFTSANWATLTGRTDRIWPVVLEALRQRPLTGYGFKVFRDVFEEFAGYWIAHPHNFFLHVLFQGGIIGFVLFAYLGVIFMKYAWKVAKYENAGLYGVSFISVFLGVLCLHGIVEYFTFIHFSLIISSIWFHKAYKRVLNKPREKSRQLS